MVKLFYVMLATSAIIFLHTESIAQSKLYKTNHGTIRFFSETPVENIDAYSEALVSAINPVNRNVAAVVAISSFTFKNAFMQEHFNEKYMESDKYPKATFSGIILETIDFTKPGTYKVTATGKLILHGVEQKRTISGTLTIDSSLNLTLKSSFNVKLVDHKIEVPQLVMQKIAEVILITIDTSYQLQ